VLKSGLKSCNMNLA